MNNQELVQKIFEMVKKAMARLDEDQTEGKPAAPGRDAGNILKPLILTSEHGKTCHQAFERLGAVCALLDAYKVDMDEICCVIMYDLTLENMFKLAYGCPDNAFSKLAAEAMLKGKQVYAVREHIELLKYEQGGAYFKLLSENLRKLQSCGVVVVAEADLDSVISGAKKPEKTAGECCGAGASLEVGKKVLTESDVRHAMMNGASEIVIRQKAIVTSLAAEYAVKRNITITRKT